MNLRLTSYSFDYRVMRWLCFILSLSFALSAVGWFLIIPMRTVQALAPEMVQRLFAQSNSLVFWTLSFLGLFFYTLSRLFCVPKDEQEAETRYAYDPKSFLGKSLFWSLCALLLARSVIGLVGTPMDWDEHGHVSQLSGPTPMTAINPFGYTQNHTVSAVSSYLLMKVFGVSKISARLPALFFLLLFCLALFSFARKHTDKEALVWLLIHLSVSPLFVWYSHSLRGYMAMMLAFFTLFLMLNRLFCRSEPLKEGELFFISLLLGIAPFLHFFSVIYNLLLFLALVGWVALFRTRLSGAVFGSVRRVLLLYILWFPLYAMFAVLQYQLLKTTGWVGSTGASDTTFRLLRILHVFGFEYLWQARLLVIAFVGLCLCYTISDTKFRQLSFSIGFCVISALFFTFMYSLSQPAFEGRFFLPVVLVFVFCLGSLVRFVPKASSRALVRLVFVLLLVVFPLRFANRQPEPLALYWENQEKFVAEVNKIARRPKCLSLSGTPDIVRYTKRIYFPRVKTDNCEVDYHLHIPFGPHEFLALVANQKLPIQRLPDPKRYQLLHRDIDGRSLYQPRPTTPKIGDLS